MNGACIYLQDFIQLWIIWEKRVFLSTLLEEHQQIFSHFNNWKIFIPHFLACHIHEHRERFFHLKRSILNEGQKINCPNSFSSHFQRFFLRIWTFWDDDTVRDLDWDTSKAKFSLQPFEFASWLYMIQVTS
mgnify:CR=1 FL=1